MGGLGIVDAEDEGLVDEEVGILVFGRAEVGSFVVGFEEVGVLSYLGRRVFRFVLHAVVGFCDELVAFVLSNLGITVPGFWDEDEAFVLSSLAIMVPRLDFVTVVDCLVVLGLLLLGLLLLELGFVEWRSGMMGELRGAVQVVSFFLSRKVQKGKSM